MTRSTGGRLLDALGTGGVSLLFEPAGRSESQDVTIGISAEPQAARPPQPARELPAREPEGAIARIRNPVGVAALILITLGIYGLYWWYQVNREMVDLGKARNVDGLGDNPTTSLLAWFPGGLIIVPALISLYNGVQRMKHAQELTTGAPATLNGWIVAVLFAIGLGAVACGYMQAELNKAWHQIPVGTSEGSAQVSREEFGVHG